MWIRQPAVRSGALGMGEVSQAEPDGKRGTRGARRVGGSRSCGGGAYLMAGAMERKRMFQVFKEARKAGPYDEFPVLLEEIDPQVYLSRNDRPQPFFLICEHDSVLVQMSGEGMVELKDAPVLYYTTEPGDFVYVPAGTPHRVVPRTES